MLLRPNIQQVEGFTIHMCDDCTWIGKGKGHKAIAYIGTLPGEEASWEAEQQWAQLNALGPSASTSSVELKAPCNCGSSNPTAIR